MRRDFDRYLGNSLYNSSIGDLGEGFRSARVTAIGETQRYACG
jgi:hypothetical protein